MCTPDAAIKATLENGKRTLPPKIDSELFILKVIGQEEYLYGDHPLIQFKVNICFIYCWIVLFI